MIRRFVREPFIQFLFLGGILFIVVSVIHNQKDKASREIVIDKERINLMLVNYQNQTGTLPTKEQLNAIIDNYIHEEISYREAKKMGLDNDDEIIRRRLSQKYDFLHADLAEVAPPSEEEVKQFYAHHPEWFQKESTVSFTHIYFSTDAHPDSVAKQKAELILKQLQQTSLDHAPEKGDHFPLQYDYSEQRRLDVQENFGTQPIVDELFNGPLHKWLGPVKSGYGWHLIYITKRDSTTLLPFDEVKEEVKIKYLEVAKAEQDKKAFDQLSQHYIIKREDLGTK